MNNSLGPGIATAGIWMGFAVAAIFVPESVITSLGCLAAVSTACVWAFNAL